MKNLPNIIASLRTITAANLPLGPGEKDAKGTQSLQNMKKLRATPDGTLSSGIISAAYYAKKMNKTMYTYVGNSYGHTVWRVTEKTSECLNPINNTGTKLVSVTPDLVMSWHEVRPDSSDKF